MDYARLASQLIRILRGKRPQTALSRRLGYRSNVLYAWESGEGYPTAAKFFRMVARLGKDPAALAKLLVRHPADFEDLDLTTRNGVATLLRALRGKRPMQALSEALNRDRFAVSRWLRGQTEPRLPEFLQFIEVTTLGLVDCLATLIDPAQVEEVSERWRALQAARRSAYELPWSHAVLRAVELDAYRRQPRHRAGWIASQLDIGVDEEQRCLELLCDTGDLRWNGTHYEVAASLTVDTGRDPAATRQLASFWMQQGAERVQHAGKGHFAFNVFGIAAKDLQRLRELQHAYFTELRALIAESQSTECVAVATFQLYPLITRAALVSSDRKR